MDSNTFLQRWPNDTISGCPKCLIQLRDSHIFYSSYLNVQKHNQCSHLIMVLPDFFKQVMSSVGNNASVQWAF